MKWNMSTWAPSTPPPPIASFRERPGRCITYMAWSNNRLKAAVCSARTTPAAAVAAAIGGDEAAANAAGASAGHGRPTTPHIGAADGYVEPRGERSGPAAGDVADKLRVMDAATLRPLWSKELPQLREVSWSEDDAYLVCALDDSVVVLNAAGNIVDQSTVCRTKAFLFLSCKH